jgi:polyferredoxin
MNRLVHGDAFAGTPVKSLADIDKPQPQGAFTRLVETLFVGWRRHFGWIQVLMFGVFLVVIGVPLLLPDPPAGSGILSNPTLFLRYMLWGIWFPLVFLSVIVLGRLWCGTLCPMGAASELANKYGLQRAIPGWIKWEGTPALSFIIMTLYGQTLGVRDHPEAAASTAATSASGAGISARSAACSASIPASAPCSSRRRCCWAAAMPIPSAAPARR